MNPIKPLLGLLAALLVAVTAHAQQAPQRRVNVGYAYPAGGQQGTEFEVTLGGQFFDGASRVFFSAQGVTATVEKHTKPMSAKDFNLLREKFQEAQKRIQAAQGGPGRPAGREDAPAVLQAVREMGVPADQIAAFLEYHRRRTDPKQQLNPQISETLLLRVTIAADAEPGPRELRVLATLGLSRPIRFDVGSLPERCEQEPNDAAPDALPDDALPLVLNGRIEPGDVDRFSFQAAKGQYLVARTTARGLVPYLADAVPGWFQATLALRDEDGNEVAYADDYRFDPDPVLHCVIPKNGRYTLEIKDAIYRGRDDFVYRIALGEIPFVTSAFPLGGRDGEKTPVRLEGWNLPVDRVTVDGRRHAPGIHQIVLGQAEGIAQRAPFAFDALPQGAEKEPNDHPDRAQAIVIPMIVNGRIDRPGDGDVFRIQGRAGGRVFAEVLARRLGSPVDSTLALTDAQGRQLAANDDCEDKACGLSTHHADSSLAFTLPADGEYFLHLGDAQRQGGADCGYRLRVSEGRPDFALRVVPSTVSARAGTNVPITMYALRRDGFAGEIALALRDAPPGFALAGARVPAGQESVRLTLALPAEPTAEPVQLVWEGRAVVKGKEIVREAVPADDLMQAFIYHHLVPAEDFLVATGGGRAGRAAFQIARDKPVRLAPGGAAQVRVAVLPWLLKQGKVHLTLVEPPEGIAIKSVSPVKDGLSVLLAADAKKVSPGLAGNLIIEAVLERAAPAPSGKPRAQRTPLGVLPAIAFEVSRK
ncbi:MAG: PPC domain-containing protein [Pirellulales bacterium]|nr:PPC domain-containing protein [Pirellulales bacterium]